MNYLILDCSAGMTLRVIKDGQEFSFVDKNEKRHSDELLVVLDNLLKEANVKISEIENICVCIGPGSFTGVRVAISICKGLAIGASAKVFVLSNFDVFDLPKNENLVFVLDGFSEFVYARIVENGKNEDKCIKISELKKLAEQKQFLVYVADEKTQNRLKINEISAQIVEYSANNAFLQKINAGENIAINQISPIYLRASQAEIERAKKMAGENK